jgi:hypothetical protein
MWISFSFVVQGGKRFKAENAVGLLEIARLRIWAA